MVAVPVLCFHNTTHDVTMPVFPNTYPDQNAVNSDVKYLTDILICTLVWGQVWEDGCGRSRCISVMRVNGFRTVAVYFRKSTHQITD